MSKSLSLIYRALNDAGSPIGSRATRDKHQVPALASYQRLVNLDLYHKHLTKVQGVIVDGYPSIHPYTFKTAVLWAQDFLRISIKDMELVYGVYLRNVSSSPSIELTRAATREIQLTILKDLKAETQEMIRLLSGKPRAFKTQISQYFADGYDILAVKPQSLGQINRSLK